MHVQCPAGLPEPAYRQVLELLRDVTPTVQAIPPGAALAELRGAFRCLGADARKIGEVVRIRALALLGVDLRIGVGQSWSVAATASGQITEPGGVLVVEADRTREFLAPLPVRAIHGVGPQQAKALTSYGLHTAGAVGAVPMATVQRILGGRAGRMAADRARGVDPRPVTPKDLPASAVVRRRFERQELDGGRVRAVLLDLVVQLGAMLRGREQAARAVSLELRFAGGASWERSRRLSEASGHDEDLRVMVFRLMDAAGLERARLVGMTLRAEDLIDAQKAAVQITLDRVRESRLLAEKAVDRANARYGAGTVVPAATLLGKAS
jgi:DNA polymerase-4